MKDSPQGSDEASTFANKGTEDQRGGPVDPVSLGEERTAVSSVTYGYQEVKEQPPHPPHPAQVKPMLIRPDCTVKETR